MYKNALGRQAAARGGRLQHRSPGGRLGHAEPARAQAGAVGRGLHRPRLQPPTPRNHIALRCNWSGWWCHEEKERLLAELAPGERLKKRKALVERIQAIFYEDVGRVKLGDYFTLDVARRDLRGALPHRRPPVLLELLARGLSK